MRIVFLIPIRGGSKGLKNKNMLYYKNKPLVCHLIDKIVSIGYSDQDIYVSTDSEQYKNDLEHLGINVYKRKPSLALDSTSTGEVVVDFLDNVIVQRDVVFVLCQATTPQMTAEDLKNAIESFTCDNNCLVSVSRADKSPQFYSEMKNGSLSDLAGLDKDYRRQDAGEYYYPNGAFYISLKSEYLKSFSFFTKNTQGYVMSGGSSIDIDTVQDFRNLLGQNYFDKVNHRDDMITFTKHKKYEKNLFISDSRGVFYQYEGVTNLSTAGISAMKVASDIECYENINSVVVMLGVNDLRYGYSVRDVINAIKNIKSKLSPNKFRVVKVLKTLYRYEVCNDLIEELNDEIAKIFDVVEVTQLEDDCGLKIKYSKDGLHLNDCGEEVLKHQLDIIMEDL